MSTLVGFSADYSFRTHFNEMTITMKAPVSYEDSQNASLKKDLVDAILKEQAALVPEIFITFNAGRFEITHASSK